MAVVQFWDTTGELASVRIWLRFRFGVLTETTVMMAVFWVVTPCSSLHMHWHWWCICFRHHHNFHWQLQTIKYQSLDIIMAATLHIIVFSSVTPYILVCECHRFGGPYCLQVQGWRASYKLAATYIQAARMTQTVLRLVRGRTVPVGSRFSTPSRPAPKRLPFCAKGTGSFSAGKSGRGVVLTTPHPSSAEFANRWPIGLPPLCACTGTTLGELYQLYRWNDPPLTSTLKMEAIYFSETSARFNKTTRSMTSEGNSIHRLFWTAFFEYLKTVGRRVCFRTFVNMGTLLDAGLSQQRPSFDTRVLHVWFVVQKVTQGQLFPFSQSVSVSPVAYNSTIAPLLIHLTASLKKRKSVKYVVA